MLGVRQDLQAPQFSYFAVVFEGRGVHLSGNRDVEKAERVSVFRMLLRSLL